MPGQAKTVSVSTAPESSNPICRPMMVTIGSIAFRSTCRLSIVLGDTPFARRADVVFVLDVEHGGT